MKKRWPLALLIVIIVLVVIIIGLMIYLVVFYSSSEADALHENSTKTIVLFCPQDDCANNLLEIIKGSNKIHCAFFDLDLDFLISILKEKNASVVVDNENYDSSLDFVKFDTRYQYSHNKFCIFDDSIVWTGSFNPTFRGDSANNNNVVVVRSSVLAKNYEAEFQELWNGFYGDGSRTKNSRVVLDGKLYENYFCPEDWCANRIVDVLKSAEHSIYFMVFSFTHSKIADVLIDKFRSGVAVSGVMEKSQNSKYSQFERLNVSGIEVVWDNNPANMHHKVFIVDGNVVVTGSFNPSLNGDTNNDENVLIIHDEKIAREFMKEFERVME